MERTRSTMITRNPDTLLVDSGFFFALLNPRDQYHDAAHDKCRIQGVELL